MRLGIVDVGTLSLRLDIYELKTASQSAPELVSKYRSMPRLGDILSGTKPPGQAEEKLLIEEFQRVRDYAKDHGCEQIHAVGTSAFRKTDSAGLLAAIREKSGINIRILSGIEEAELTARGIFTNENDLPDEITLVDIGGGSTEISFCKSKTITKSVSIEIGVLTIEREFLRGRRGADGKFPPQIVEQVKKHVAEKLAPLRGSPAGDCIVGSSGTFRTLERLGVLEQKIPPLIGSSMLDEFLHRAGSMSRDALLAIPAMEEARVDVLLPGGIILQALFAVLQTDTSRVTHYSLRHGVLAKLSADLSNTQPA